MQRLPVQRQQAPQPSPSGRTQVLTNLALPQLAVLIDILHTTFCPVVTLCRGPGATCSQQSLQGGAHLSTCESASSCGISPSRKLNSGKVRRNACHPTHSSQQVLHSILQHAGAAQAAPHLARVLRVQVTQLAQHNAPDGHLLRRILQPRYRLAPAAHTTAHACCRLARALE